MIFEQFHRKNATKGSQHFLKRKLTLNLSFTLTIRHKGCRRMNHIPACLPEHLNLMTRSVRVRQHHTRTYDVERCIDMHWVRVCKTDGVYPESLRFKMSLHPFNALKVCHLFGVKRLALIINPVLFEVRWEHIPQVSHYHLMYKNETTSHKMTVFSL